jgi:drug/metabolite transporter (DMT)-like permease
MLLWAALPYALAHALGKLDPATLTCFRFVCAAAFLAGVLAARGELPPLDALRGGPAGLLALAILGLAANYLGFLLGLARTDAANVQVLIQTAPLLLALGGVLVFRESFTRWQQLGLLVLLAGLALFLRAQLVAFAAEAARYRAGVAWIAFAAVTWAGYGLAQKQLLRSLSSQQLMLWIYAGCALCFAPWTEPARFASLGALDWAVVAFCAANTLVAYGAFAAALEHVEASRVSAVLALSPLATLAFRAVLPGGSGGEPLTLTGFAGALLVVGGSLAMALGAAPTGDR